MTFFKSPIDMELQILSLSFQHSWQPDIILLKQGRKLRNYSKCNKKLYVSGRHYKEKSTGKELLFDLACFDSLFIWTHCYNIGFYTFMLKDPLSCLRKCLTMESPLWMIKIIFYFMLKALFVLEIFIGFPDFLIR